MPDRQVSENLIMLFNGVAAFGHHGGHQDLRSGDSVCRRVDELLLDARPLARLACPGRIGERLDVKSLDLALAFGQFGFRLAPAAALTYQPAVFRAEALLVDHPGNLGGHETWEDAGSWRHRRGTRTSCVNAR